MQAILGYIAAEIIFDEIVGRYKNGLAIAFNQLLAFIVPFLQKTLSFSACSFFVRIIKAEEDNGGLWIDGSYELQGLFEIVHIGVSFSLKGILLS